MCRVLYGSLLFLAWGIFFKSPGLLSGGMAVLATGFLIATAIAEEKENLRFFGDSYRKYWNRRNQMDDFDQKCLVCAGSGRMTSGHEHVDTRQHRVAALRYQIAQLTEDFGLDLCHRVSIPGEADARRRVGELQAELAETLDDLDAARLAAGGQEVICPHCRGRGFILTEAGKKLFDFICRWIHPQQ